ncbi:MAG TPA: flagellar motor switch phosphatase FliY, partial [Caldithrix sp.]|nr:flagellar motor switch phosphatase FliY [Caldithrix sp.]
MSNEVETTPVEEANKQNLVKEPEAPTQPEEETPEISQVKMENFNDEEPTATNGDRLDLIMDIVLPVSIELGRTKMLVKQILELERGSIIELDKMAGEPV